MVLFREAVHTILARLSPLEYTQTHARTTHKETRKPHCSLAANSILALLPRVRHSGSSLRPTPRGVPSLIRHKDLYRALQLVSVRFCATRGTAPSSERSLVLTRLCPRAQQLTALAVNHRKLDIDSPLQPPTVREVVAPAA